MSSGEKLTWRARPKKWDWKSYLTEEETSVVRDAERQAESAKMRLAEATFVLNPIRNRAIHRAKYASRRALAENGNG
jgi:hypothetical protein